jgi:probable rRNA maturation factor
MKVGIYNFDILKKHFPNTEFNKKDLKESFLKVISKDPLEEVNIIFVSLDEIKRLNEEFRKKDTPTDVLSFTIEETPLVGEIYVCPEYIVQEYDHEEVLRVIVHGFLHILGYKHDKHFSESSRSKEKMFVKQENMLQNILYEINNRPR